LRIATSVHHHTTLLNIGQQSRWSTPRGYFQDTRQLTTKVSRIEHDSKGKGIERYVVKY